MLRINVTKWFSNGEFVLKYGLYASMKQKLYRTVYHFCDLASTNFGAIVARTCCYTNNYINIYVVQNVKLHPFNVYTLIYHTIITIL